MQNAAHGGKKVAFDTASSFSMCGGNELRTVEHHVNAQAALSAASCDEAYASASAGEVSARSARVNALISHSAGSSQCTSNLRGHSAFANAIASPRRPK